MSFLVQFNEFQEFYRFISGIHNYVLYSVWLNLVCIFRYFFQAAIFKKYECALKVWSITVLRISHMNGFNVNCRCVHLWRKMSWYLTKNVTRITQRELALLMLEEQYRKVSLWRYLAQRLKGTIKKDMNYSSLRIDLNVFFPLSLGSKNEFQ